ncbi:hypothetical protein [Prescottella agglutinans]|uniref:Uncharacterized protein n=1 Tax=Prescottella agglutinans TaxID=1644129 RepID=A0ABT6M5B1_9NOCA|nr:hypothetical protein [Prescottella agglutinans]MDH6279488.1 hypothetical protein [Prescottella agglutinans]
MTGDDVEGDLIAETSRHSVYGPWIERARTNAHAIAAGAPVIDFEEVDP